MCYSACVPLSLCVRVGSYVIYKCMIGAGAGESNTRWVRDVCDARDVRLVARPEWHKELFPTVEGSQAFSIIYPKKKPKKKSERAFWFHACCKV